MSNEILWFLLAFLLLACAVLSFKLRKAKSERKLSLKATVKSLEIKGAITERLFSGMKEDLMAATGAEKITFSVGKESSVSVGI